MPKKDRILLVIDGIVDLLLGLPLLLVPSGFLDLLGLPAATALFYPGILGAVLFGIGIALLLEAIGGANGIRGLGIEGAIAINFCGSIALLVWLIAGSLDMPHRGYVLLWMVAILVLGIAVAELIARIGFRNR